MHRRLILIMIVAVGTLTLASLIVVRARFPRQELRTCLADARGLRPGAEVRIAGVQVGMVRAVTAKPQDKNCPAEVELDISTPYDLKIPKDAVVEVQSGGLLGPALLSIDVRHATGDPAAKGAYLSSRDQGEPPTDGK